MNGLFKKGIIIGFGLFLLSGSGRDFAWAQPTVEPFNEDVSATKHNLSANPPLPTDRNLPLNLFQQLFSPDKQRNINAVPGPAGTTEVCVFCHTPHGANQEGVKFRAPIWNRTLSSAQYQMYDQVWSKSFEARPNNPGHPTGYSRLCLSCHDGTIALGSVLNKQGSGGLNGSIQMEYPTGQAPAGPFGSMPVGEGPTGQAPPHPEHADPARSPSPGDRQQQRGVRLGSMHVVPQPASGRLPEVSPGQPASVADLR